MRFWGADLGVTRTGRLTDDQAVRYAEVLVNDRKRADYGYATVPEPYDRFIVDERLRCANQLVEDLKTLL